MSSLNRPSVNVQSGDVAFPVVQAVVVGGELRKRGDGGRDRDEGEGFRKFSGDKSCKAWGLTGVDVRQMELWRLVV